MKFRITAQAREELREIEEYIGQDNPKAAIAFLKRLIERFRELCDMPGIGRKRDELAPGMRSSAVGDYLVFYHVLDGELEVVHVVHGHRNLEKVFEQE